MTRQQRLVDALQRRGLVGGEARLAGDVGPVRRRDDVAHGGDVADDGLGGVVARPDRRERGRAVLGSRLDQARLRRA